MIGFKAVAIEELRKELAHQADEIDESSGKHIASSYNLVLLVEKNDDDQALESLIKFLTPFRPGRIFVVQLVEGVESLQTEISLVCHRLDKDSSICSDIIKVALSKDQIPRLASIVRSLMLTGRTLTTYLVHSFDYDSRVKSILEMSDTIVFDSLSLDVAKWYECNSFRSIEKLVDVQWLRLSGWREHVKLSFEAPHAYQRLHDLAALEVTMGETPGALLNAWLLVHWLLAHLDLTLGDKRDGVIELRGAQHRQAELRLTKKSSNYNALPSRCAMNFLGPQKTSVVLESLIGEIRTEFSDQENLVVTSRFDDLSPDQLVCRFFEAGETINEYRRYLARALSSVRELGA